MKILIHLLLSSICLFDVSDHNPDQGMPTGWHTGSLHLHVLDGLNTTKTWNNIDLLPGMYRWKVETRSPEEEGKVHFDITVKHSAGPNTQPVKESLNAGASFHGKFSIPDYRSKETGEAGFGRIKIHIGRAGMNTTMNYRITLTRVGEDR
jgi:hypothetical protein